MEKSIVINYYQISNIKKSKYQSIKYGETAYEISKIH